MIKSLKDYAMEISEEQYRKLPMLSYSTIARYEREGFDALPNLFDPIYSESLTFGSLVDTMITEPDEFDNRYIVSDDVKMPTDALMPIARQILADYPDIKKLDQVPTHKLSEIAKEYGYFKDDKYDKMRGGKVYDGIFAYVNLQLKAKGKQIIDSAMLADARACVEGIKANPETAKLFKPEELFSDIESYSQLKFKAEYKGVELRCMFDRIVVLHDKKVIVPIDLKTSFKPGYHFPESFIKWRYDIQADLYTYILREALSDTEYKDYTITPFRFVVTSRNKPIPVVWIANPEEVADVMSKRMKGYRNWRSIVPELKYYLDNKSEMPMDIKAINSVATALVSDSIWK